MSLMAEDDALVAEAVASRFDTTKPGLISSAINHSVRRQKPFSWHPHKSMLPTHTYLSVASTRTEAMLLDSNPPAFASIHSIELLLPFVFFPNFGICQGSNLTSNTRSQKIMWLSHVQDALVDTKSSAFWLAYLSTHVFFFLIKTLSCIIIVANRYSKSTTYNIMWVLSRDSFFAPLGE